MLNYLSVISIIAILCVGAYLFIVDSKIEFLKEQINTKNVYKINYEDEDEENDEEEEEEVYEQSLSSENDCSETSEEPEDIEDIEDRKIYTIEEENVNSVLEEMYKDEEDEEKIDIVVKKRGRPKKQC